jgi:hypothetical protein
VPVPETPATDRTGRLQFVQAAVSPTRAYRRLRTGAKPLPEFDSSLTGDELHEKRTWIRIDRRGRH